MNILTLILWLAGGALALLAAYFGLRWVITTIVAVTDWVQDVDSKLENLTEKCKELKDDLRAMDSKRSLLTRHLREAEEEIRALKTHTGLEAKEAVEDVTKEFV